MNTSAEAKQNISLHVPKTTNGLGAPWSARWAPILSHMPQRTEPSVKILVQHQNVP